MREKTDRQTDGEARDDRPGQISQHKSPQAGKQLGGATRGRWGRGAARGTDAGPEDREPRKRARAPRPLTLMHCDIAAVPVAVNERVLGPAPLVGAHAAAADHLLHASGELALQ